MNMLIFLCCLVTKSSVIRCNDIKSEATELCTNQVNKMTVYNK